MRIARHVVFAVCLIMSIATVALTASDYLEEKNDQFVQVLFCTLCVLMSIGILACIMQFIMKRIGNILTYVFFGFLAGIMVTNFVSEVVSRTTYDSWVGYLTSYGLMIFFFVLSIAGVALIQATDDTLL